jgi:hypothetical protein
VIHDTELLDRLSELPRRQLEGRFYRATGVSVDPTAPSINGGRWSLKAEGDYGTPAVYTSFERNGALAELCSFLADLTPVPKARLIKVTELTVALPETVHLGREHLIEFGIDLAHYGRRDYRRTQQIGAGLAFLGVLGLVAPSARWDCENLVIFHENPGMADLVSVGHHETLDWRAWAQDHGLLPKVSS